MPSVQSVTRDSYVNDGSLLRGKLEYVGGSVRQSLACLHQGNIKLGIFCTELACGFMGDPSNQRVDVDQVACAGTTVQLDGSRSYQAITALPVPVALGVIHRVLVSALATLQSGQYSAGESLLDDAAALIAELEHC